MAVRPLVFPGGPALFIGALAIILSGCSIHSFPGGNAEPFTGTSKTVDGIPIPQAGDSTSARSAFAVTGNKLVVAVTSGSGSMVEVARYNANLSLDSNFGRGGVVTTSIQSSGHFGNAIVVQRDGKIIVVGFTVNSNVAGERIVVGRYLVDGTIDGNYGNGGTVVTDISSSKAKGSAVALQSDGKLIVAGNVKNAAGDYEFALLRYEATGILDSSFGNGGVLLTDIGTGNDKANSILIQDDGKVLLAGYTSHKFGKGEKDHFAIARFLPTGVLDSTFGSSGSLAVSISDGDDRINAMALQPDGKIVIAGQTSGSGSNGLVLLRLNSDGSRDGSFGAGGLVNVPVGSGQNEATALCIDMKGRVVVAGTDQNKVDGFVAVRIDSNGGLDSTFGSQGAMDYSNGKLSHPHSVLIQKDGNIVIAGTGYNKDKGYDFSIIRVATDGKVKL